MNEESTLERDHRVGPVREGHDVRAGGIQDLSPPDVLRRARRSRAYVNFTRHGEEPRMRRLEPRRPDRNRGHPSRRLLRRLLRMTPGKWMQVN